LFLHSISSIPFIFRVRSQAKPSRNFLKNEQAFAVQQKQSVNPTGRTIASLYQCLSKDFVS
jgi:hypothetical protein